MSTLDRQLRSALERHQHNLACHPVHAAVDSLPRLRAFTEHHVAAVWDFMALLKSLQRDIAPAHSPWLPPVDPEAARLINAIVLDEESDSLPYRPAHASHFVWYVEAMAELGADVRPVHDWIARMRAGAAPLDAMAAAGLPPAARDFVATTLSFLPEPLPVRAAVFLHGREEVIPRLFLPLVRRLRAQGIACDRLLGYLERHVEVDGGAHAAHATALLERLFAAAPELRERGQRAALHALAARQRLWDAILAAL